MYANSIHRCAYTHVIYPKHVQYTMPLLWGRGLVQGCLPPCSCLMNCWSSFVTQPSRVLMEMWVRAAGVVVGTTPCSRLFAGTVCNCKACGHVDQLDPLLSVESISPPISFAQLLLNHAFLVVAGDEGGVQDLQDLLFHSMDVPTSCGESATCTYLRTYDNTCAMDNSSDTFCVCYVRSAYVLYVSSLLPSLFCWGCLSTCHTEFSTPPHPRFVAILGPGTLLWHDTPIACWCGFIRLSIGVEST